MLEKGEIRVNPSILAADFGELAEAANDVAPVTNWLHVDVMDGHFVPNLTIGPPVVASLRKHSAAFFDCHLMVTNPGELVEAFAKAGANLTTIHAEVGDTEALIAQMRRLGLSVGLALNPDTPFSVAEPYLEGIDLLLLMTVFPGFGGQSFIEDVVPKIKEAGAEIERRSLRVVIEVDGGIDAETAPVTARAGARVFVAGTAVFGDEDPPRAVVRIQDAVLAALGGR